MTNLARILTDATRAHAGRVAVRVDNEATTARSAAPDDRVADQDHEVPQGEEVGAAVVLKPGAGISAEEQRDHIVIPADLALR